MKKNNSYGIIPIFIDETEKPHFLIIKHAAGHWAFPKGHVEKGEAPEDTALRELQEETGISKCDILDFPPLEETYIAPENKEKGLEKENKTVKYYLGDVKDTTVDISNSSGEIIDYMWLPYETAHKRITYQGGKSILTKTFQYITQTKL